MHEIAQRIYEFCDIDTKLVLSRATGVRYKNKKPCTSVSLKPITIYNPRFPHERKLLNIPYNRNVDRILHSFDPWVSGWSLGLTMLWGRYRVERGTCNRCGGDTSSTFTTAESDFVPGYLVSRERSDDPPFYASNSLSHFLCHQNASSRRRTSIGDHSCYRLHRQELAD